MNNTVVLVQFLNDKIVRKISSFKNGGQFKVIALSNQAASHLVQKKIKYTDFADYIDSTSFQGINDMAVKAVRSWHQNKELSKICDFENINMGQFSEAFLTAYFIEIFKKIVILENIFTVEKPNFIVYSSDIEPMNMGLPEDLWSKIIIEFAKINNVQIKALHCKTYSRKFLVRERLKQLYYSLLQRKQRQKFISSNNKTIIFTGSAKFWAQSSQLIKLLQAENYDIKMLTRREGFRKIKFKKPSQPFEYKKINLWKIIADRLNYEFNYVYPKLISEMKQLKNIMDKNNVKAIITPSSVAPNSRAAIKQAELRNILSIEIQHGITKWAPSFLPLTADKVFVWGQMTKDWYCAQGIEDNRVEITGRLTPSLKINLTNKIKAKQKLNLPVNKKVIMIATQPAIAIDSLSRIKGNVPMLRTIITELQPLLDEKITIIIKPHPSENIEDYNQILRNPNKIIFLNKNNVEDCLQATELLMAGDSSLVIDAILAGLPTAYLNLEETKHLVPYHEYGAVPIFKVNQILPVVNKIIKGNFPVYQKDKLEEMIKHEDKEAAQNAFASIKSLLNT